MTKSCIALKDSKNPVQVTVSLGQKINVERTHFREFAFYGRTHLIYISESPPICLSLLTLIDAFGLYRNMYRSIFGIYVTIKGLNWQERQKRANVLPLALGRHGSDFTDVIKILEPGLSSLDRGLHAEIKNLKTLLCVYTMAFTADMKQQTENSGSRSPLANRGCGKCLVTKVQKAFPPIRPQ